MRPLLGTALVAALAACSPSPAVDGAAADAAVPPDLRIAHDLLRPSGSVIGLFVDENGAPLDHEFVSVCNPIGCNSAFTAADGTVTLSQLQLAPFTFRNHDDLTANPRKGVGLVQLVLTENGMALDGGKIYVPTLGAGADLAGPVDAVQTLAVGDGLSLTLREQDLEFPIGYDTKTLVARQVPPARWPRFDLGGEQLLDVYSLAPFSTTAKAPVAVKAPTTLPAGTAVRFRAVHEFEGVLSDPVAGHSDGSFVTTDAGTGIDRITWILISR